MTEPEILRFNGSQQECKRDWRMISERPQRILEPGASGDGVASRGVVLQLVAINAFAMLARFPYWISERVSLIAPESRCLLSPTNVWQVPLASTTANEWLTEIPLLLSAPIAALILTCLVWHIFPTQQFLTALLGASLSLVIRPLDIVPLLGILVLAVCLKRDTFDRLPGARLFLILLVTIGMIVTTLEFGLILLWLTSLLLLQRRRGTEFGTSNVVDVLVLVGLVGTVSMLHPGFLSTWMRPVSRLGVVSSPTLLPHMQPTVVCSLAWPLLIGLCVAAWQTLRAHPHSKLLWVTMLWLGIVTFACRDYAVLGAACVLSLLPVCRRPMLLGQYDKAGLTGLLLIVLAVFSWRTDKTSVLAGQSPVRHVDPSAWSTTGTVLLTDLSHAHRWQSGSMTKQYTLVLDDRWEVFSSHYADYLRVVTDLKQGHVLAFLRDDGTLGGYQRSIVKWDVALVEVDATDLAAVRRLTYSPDMKFLAADEQRVILGNQNLPEIRPQLAASLQAIMMLEWPTPQHDLAIDSVLVANTDRSALRVANLLCAMRLPYAAMRFIREDTSESAERTRTLCLLELAHRALRQSSTGSLLDQHRAVVRLLNEAQQGWWEPAAVTRRLQALGAVDRSELLQARESDRRSAIRKALLAGDREFASKRLDEFAADSSEAALYDVILKSPALAPGEIRAHLTKVLDSTSDIDDSLRAELYFYLGCLALEIGETESAIQGFRASLFVDAESAFSFLCRFHLSQLAP